MLYSHSDTWRQVLNHAFRKASALPLCTELVYSFNFLCTVCIVCKVCRLAVDFLHIRSHPHQLMMSEPQARDARQCPSSFGRLLWGQEWNSQSLDTVWFLFVDSLIHCLCISHLNIWDVAIHEDIWLIPYIYFQINWSVVDKKQQILEEEYQGPLLHPLHRSQKQTACRKIPPKIIFVWGWITQFYSLKKKLID